jgi:hypothetical protein
VTFLSLHPNHAAATARICVEYGESRLGRCLFAEQHAVESHVVCVFVGHGGTSPDRYVWSRIVCMNLSHVAASLSICSPVPLYSSQRISVLRAGNGSIGLVHGFIGVCFAVEAFYGAARYDSAILLRCIVFQVISMFICMAIGIAGFSQATTTCDGKPNYSTCFAEVQLRSSLYLFGGGGFCFVFAVVMLIFWRQMTVAMLTREAADQGTRWRLQ